LTEEITMTTDTDIRLRSHLDANQRDREQLSRAITHIACENQNIVVWHHLGPPGSGIGVQVGRNPNLHFFSSASMLL